MAAFKLGEVQDALALLEKVNGLRRVDPEVLICAVVGGYSTVAVRNQIAAAVDRVLIFEDEGFGAIFEDFLQWALLRLSFSRPLVPQPQRPDPELAERLDALNRKGQEDLKRLNRAVADMSTQIGRKAETARAMRAADRMIETLRSFADLLEREENTAIRVFAEPDRNATRAAKLEEVFQLLDEQRAYVRRAGLINDRRPDPGVTAALSAVEDLVDEAERMWVSVYEQPTTYATDLFLDDMLPLGQIRDHYRRRREALDHLEKRYLG